MAAEVACPPLTIAVNPESQRYPAEGSADPRPLVGHENFASVASRVRTLAVDSDSRLIDHGARPFSAIFDSSAAISRSRPPATC